MTPIYHDKAAQEVHKAETALTRIRQGSSVSAAAIATAKVASLVAPDSLLASNYLTIAGVWGLICLSAFLHKTVLHIKSTEANASHSTIVKTSRTIKFMMFPLTISALCTCSDIFPLFSLGAAAFFVTTSLVALRPNLAVIDFNFVPEHLD
ncbi:MAG: hypothetical protein JSS32_05995 [Verrucomicrobia bacterium]|nr:hypothetical protein [Verrucomicrobiota bacterium]